MNRTLRETARESEDGLNDNRVTRDILYDHNLANEEGREDVETTCAALATRFVALSGKTDRRSKHHLENEIKDLLDHGDYVRLLPGIARTLERPAQFVAFFSTLEPFAANRSKISQECFEELCRMVSEREITNATVLDAFPAPPAVALTSLARVLDDDAPFVRQAPGGRHDNDCLSIADISLVPTRAEMEFVQTLDDSLDPLLPRLNDVHGHSYEYNRAPPPDSPQRLCDAHFRILRAIYVGQIARTLHDNDHLDDVESKKRRSSLLKARFTGLVERFNVSLDAKRVSIPTLSFELTDASSGVLIKTLERRKLLRKNDLVCVWSTDVPNSRVFGILASDAEPCEEPSNKKVIVSIDLTSVPGPDAHRLIRLQGRISMLQLGVGFHELMPIRAAQDAFNRCDEWNDELSDAICRRHVGAELLSPNTSWRIDPKPFITSVVVQSDVESGANTVGEHAPSLSKDQRRAPHGALTRGFFLVRGPPGTGTAYQEATIPTTIAATAP